MPILPCGVAAFGEGPLGNDWRTLPVGCSRQGQAGRQAGMRADAAKVRAKAKAGSSWVAVAVAVARPHTVAAIGERGGERESGSGSRRQER